jgi:NAD+ kinase
VKLALVVHPDRDTAAELAADLTARAARRGIRVSAQPADAARVPGTTVRLPGRPVEADVVVAVGGDGTVLEAVRVGLAADLPVLGVNAGHLGFLTGVEPNRLDDALDALAAGGWAESQRMTLTAQVAGRAPAVGINDVVVEKAVSQHVVKISVQVGAERLVSYRADAVVVATPTGSTAYTFSAGGPLVDPQLEALVVTAVAPHNLFGRPIVLRPDAHLRLTVDDDRPARVNVDGRTLTMLAPGAEILVARGDHPARFVELWPRNFVASVREKFQLHDA